MSSRLSGSKLPLAFHCLKPFTPDAVWPKQESGAPAQFGKAFHLATEDWYAKGIVDLAAIAVAHELSPEDDARLERTFDGWTKSRFADLPNAVPEWTGAFDWASVTYTALPRGQGREVYATLPSTAIPAMLDLVRVDVESGVGEVHDWKTGRTKLPEAQDNWQLKFGALLLARVHGLDRVRVFLHTVNEEGDIVTTEGEIDALDFDIVEATVAAWAKTAESGNVPTVPGEHCTQFYCPMRATCPATIEAERALAPVPDDEPVVYPLTGEITSHEQARWILHRIDAVQAAVDLATKLVREYADASGGIPSEGDRHWGRFVDEWDETDLSKLTEQGAAVLRMFGLDGLVEPWLATSSIKASLKTRGLRGKALDGEYRAIMAALEGAGLTKKKQRVVYTERKGVPKVDAKESAE